MANSHYEKKWMYISIGLMTVLVTGFVISAFATNLQLSILSLVGSFTAVDNIRSAEASEVIVGQQSVPEVGSESSAGSNRVYADFNGDGKDDLAIGVILEDIGAFADAGAVNVIYGSDSGLTSAGDQLWHQNSPGIADKAEDGDFFGSAVAAGDFNGDGKDDLAISVRSEDVGTITNAGAVNVIYGSASGLTSSGNQLWHQDSPNISDTAEVSDSFGRTLAIGDYNGDGRDDLAIGVDLEDVGVITDAGAVNVIYGSPSGLTSTGNQLWHQDTPDIIDEAEADNEGFGFGLAPADFNGDGKDDLAVGVPGEDVGVIIDAGAVNVIYGSDSGLTSTGNQFWHHDTPDIVGEATEGGSFGHTLAAGDFNRDGRDDLATSSPFAPVGVLVDAGIVNVIYGSTSGLTSTGNQLWHQDTPDIIDTVEAGDSLGLGLAAADFNGDGKDDLAIGVRDEDVGTIINAGAVNVIYGSDSGLTSTDNQFWHQDTPDIGDAAENDDSLGRFLAAADYNRDGKDDLAIAVPSEDIETIVDAGAVNVIYGSTSGLTSTGNQFWHQDSSGIDDKVERGDSFSRLAGYG